LDAMIARKLMTFVTDVTVDVVDVAVIVVVVCVVRVDVDLVVVLDVSVTLVAVAEVAVVDVNEVVVVLPVDVVEVAVVVLLTVVVVTVVTVVPVDVDVLVNVALVMVPVVDVWVMVDVVDVCVTVDAVVVVLVRVSVVVVVVGRQKLKPAPPHSARGLQNPEGCRHRPLVLKLHPTHSAVDSKVSLWTWRRFRPGGGTGPKRPRFSSRQRIDPCTHSSPGSKKQNRETVCLQTPLELKSQLRQKMGGIVVVESVLVSV